MSHQKLRPFIVKVSVLGYFTLPTLVESLMTQLTYTIMTFTII